MNNTVQKIIKRAKDQVKTSNNQVRYGQALMNVLSKVSPFLYHQIINTDNDCFYNDKNINNFMGAVTEYFNRKDAVAVGMVKYDTKFPEKNTKTDDQWEMNVSVGKTLSDNGKE